LNFNESIRKNSKIMGFLLLVLAIARVIFGAITMLLNWDGVALILISSFLIIPMANDWICQKNLITQGTIKDFEKIFDGKIIYKIME